MFIQYFEELISPDFRVPSVGNVYILEENKNDAKQKNIQTKLKSHGKILVYKFDKEGYKLFPFLTTVKHVQRISDYVVIAEKNDKVYVFVIELSYTQEKEYQYAATKHFMEYIVKCCARINSNNLKRNYETLKPVYQYLCLVKLPTQKGTTKFKYSEKHWPQLGKDIDLSEYFHKPER